jgi:hypothetical protein
VLERRPAVDPEARDPEYGELDRQHVPLLPRREVARRAVDRADRRIGKGRGVEPRRVLGVAVVPEADRVLRRLRHVTPQGMRHPRRDRTGLAGGWRRYHGRAKIQTALATHMAVPPLTAEQVLGWANAHHARMGKWPIGTSGPIPAPAGETWAGVNPASPVAAVACPAARRCTGQRASVGGLWHSQPETA